MNLAGLRDSKTFTHALFRFPGRFHPPLVAYLIRRHPEAKVIGDPMVGSGTSAVETVISGRDGIFTDIDPLSCLLTRAKTTPFNPDWVGDALSFILRRAQPLAKRGTTKAVANRAIADMEGSTQFRAPPDVFKWFQPYVAANLAKTLRISAELKTSQSQSDAILSIFAGAIRRLSRADPATASGLEVTKIRRRALKEGLRFDIESELLRKAQILSSGYKQMLALPMLGKAVVVEHDAKDWSALCVKSKTLPDLVITSPCYFSAIEYWRRHRLEYCWLGLVEPAALKSVKQGFLGMGTQAVDFGELPEYVARLYTDLSNKVGKSRATKLARYFQDSLGWVREVGRLITKTHGTAYVVVGSNTSHGLHVDTPRALREIAAREGLKASTLMTYRIHNAYMQYKTDTQRIGSETVLCIVPS